MPCDMWGRAEGRGRRRHRKKMNDSFSGWFFSRGSFQLWGFVSLPLRAAEGSVQKHARKVWNWLCLFGFFCISISLRWCVIQGSEKPEGKTHNISHPCCKGAHTNWHPALNAHQVQTWLLFLLLWIRSRRCAYFRSRRQWKHKEKGDLVITPTITSSVGLVYEANV